VTQARLRAKRASELAHQERKRLESEQAANAKLKRETLSLEAQMRAATRRANRTSEQVEREMTRAEDEAERERKRAEEEQMMIKTLKSEEQKAKDEAEHGMEQERQDRVKMREAEVGVGVVLFVTASSVIVVVVLLVALWFLNKRFVKTKSELEDVSEGYQRLVDEQQKAATQSTAARKELISKNAHLQKIRLQLCKITDCDRYSRGSDCDHYSIASSLGDGESVDEDGDRVGSGKASNLTTPRRGDDLGTKEKMSYSNGLMATGVLRMSSCPSSQTATNGTTRRGDDPVRPPLHSNPAPPPQRLSLGPSSPTSIRVAGDL